MKTLKLAVAALMALAATHARADETNLVQNISIQMYGVQQGNSVTNRHLVLQTVNVVREDTRKVIQALAAATANSFSSTSKLVLVTPLDGSGASVQVRDGGNQVDVSGFFILQSLSNPVVGAVSGLRGRSLQTGYFIERFLLQDSPGYTPLTLHFDVNGFATQTSASGVSGQPGGSTVVSVAGSGDSNGASMVLQGTISVLGNTTEVVSSGGGLNL